MHELPVTESILEIALRHAQKADATRITDLHLVIGQLATLVDDSIFGYGGAAIPIIRSSSIGT